VNAHELADRLGREAEAVCRHYLPKGRRSGRYWRIGDAAGTPGRSTFVRLHDTLDGRKAGRWQDAATGDYGDLLDIIRLSCGLLSVSDAMVEAQRFVGLPASRRDAARVFPGQNTPGQQAARLFATGRALPGSHAEVYLRHRAITCLREATALRHLARCAYLPDDGPTEYWPALLAAATDIAGRLVAVQRLYLQNAPELTDDGKAPIDAPRKTLGDYAGAAVRFGTVRDTLAVGEGIETVLSFRSALPSVPAAAALSAGNLGQLVLPDELSRLLILVDNDPAGEGAADRLTKRAETQGITVTRLIPQLGDFNDDLRQFGEAWLHERLCHQLGASLD
jgi:hypothetical protein